MYPMDEGGHYDLNPGEGFAETYRVLNGQPLTDEDDDWTIVSGLFRPNAWLLAAARRDVLVPWHGPTTVRLTGRIGRGGMAGVLVKTPLDGTLEYRLAGATAGGATFGRRVVCGTRSVALALRGRPGARYVVRALRP